MSHLRLTEPNEPPTSATPVILTPDLQQAVEFLGAVHRIRADGNTTGGQMAIVEHEGERGYCAPLHLHSTEEEAFLVLQGELRLEVNDQPHTAEPAGWPSCHAQHRTPSW